MSARSSPGRHHTFARRGDPPALERALAGSPNPSRPRARMNHPASSRPRQRAGAMERLRPRPRSSTRTRFPGDRNPFGARSAQRAVARPWPRVNVVGGCSAGAGAAERRPPACACAAGAGAGSHEQLSGQSAFAVLPRPAPRHPAGQVSGNASSRTACTPCRMMGGPSSVIATYKKSMTTAATSPMPIRTMLRRSTARHNPILACPGDTWANLCEHLRNLVRPRLPKVCRTVKRPDGRLRPESCSYGKRPRPAGYGAAWDSGI